MSTIPKELIFSTITPITPSNPLFALAKKEFEEKQLQEALTSEGADLNGVDPTTGDTAARLLYNRFFIEIHKKIKLDPTAYRGDPTACLEKEEFLTKLFKLGAIPNAKWEDEGGMFLNTVWDRYRASRVKQTT